MAWLVDSDESLDHGEEIALVEATLHQIGISSDLHAALAVCVRREGRHQHHGYIGELLIAANLGREVEAIHPRHIDVGDHDIDATAAQLLEAIDPSMAVLTWYPAASRSTGTALEHTAAALARTADFSTSETLRTGMTCPVPRTVAPAIFRTRGSWGLSLFTNTSCSPSTASMRKAMRFSAAASTTTGTRSTEASVAFFRDSPRASSSRTRETACPFSRSVSRLSTVLMSALLTRTTRST